MPETISSIWARVCDERSVTAAATTQASDYRLVSRWLQDCPVQEPERMREAMVWVLRHPQQTSRRKVATYLRVTARYAHQVLRLLPGDPLEDFRMPKRQQAEAEVVVIPRDEVGTVMWFLAQGRAGSTDWLPYAQFLLQTGLRTGELFGLRWSDWDRDASRMQVARNLTTQGLREATKTGRARVVPVNRTARQVLEAMPQDGEAIFPASRLSFASFFQDRMQVAHEHGRVRRRYRPYDLRHTALSRWLEAGIPVAQVAKWAGNSPAVVMQHYANATQPYDIPEL